MFGFPWISLGWLWLPLGRLLGPFGSLDKKCKENQMKTEGHGSQEALRGSIQRHISGEDMATGGQEMALRG